MPAAMPIWTGSVGASFLYPKSGAAACNGLEPTRTDGSAHLYARAETRRRVKRSKTKLHRLRPIRTVIAGLDPAIHLSEMAVLFKDGYAGQARV